MSIDQVAPTLYTFLSITMDFLPEVAKFRAARRVWARLVRDRYGARDPRSEQLKIFAFTAGSTFTAQQPMNNVVRASMEATAAALRDGTYRPPRNPDRLAAFEALDEAFHVDLERLVEASQRNDVGGAAAALGSVLQACQGCHSEFRP